MAKVFSLYFRKNCRCIEKNFDDAYKLVKYVRRYHGNIKDYRCFPRWISNADMVELEVENLSTFRCLCPLEKCSLVEEVILNG